MWFWYFKVLMVKVEKRSVKSTTLRDISGNQFRYFTINFSSLLIYSRIVFESVPNIQLKCCRRTCSTYDIFELVLSANKRIGLVKTFKNKYSKHSQNEQLFWKVNIWIEDRISFKKNESADQHIKVLLIKV